MAEKLPGRSGSAGERQRGRALDPERAKKGRVNLGEASGRWRALRAERGLRRDEEVAQLLLDSFLKGRSVAETSDATLRTDWTSSEESTCSGSESENYAKGEENGAAASQQNGHTADLQRKPSAPDEEGSCDLSESSYVNLNREVLVTLMFRCLECSSECRVQGKGKGGNLLFRQECLICCNYRVWTSQSAQIIKEEETCLPVTSPGCDAERDWGPEQKIHDNSSLKQEDRVDVNAVQEEAQATGSIISFEVKQEKEDDVDGGVESLLVEKCSDQVQFSSIQESIEADVFNVASVSIGRTEPPHASLTAEEEAVPDQDCRRSSFSGEGEPDFSENDSKTSVSSSCETSDSSDEEERSGEDLTKKHPKIFQNTIKPIYWCVDCGAVANMQCTVRRHQKIFGCSACGPGDGVEGCRFKGFSVYFSDKYSFHKHAIAEHGATEIPHERTVCPDCNKSFRVQSDPSKQGHVCEYKVKPFSCHLCHKRFATEVGQKVHYRRLHRDYTHLCKFCMEVFDTRASKLEHEQSHSEDGLPFLCPDCPAQFKDFIARNKHLKSHRGQKTYTCHKCDRILSSLNGYERHLLVHSGEKPYVCEVCERSFNQAGHLKSHMRLHTGERPFMCEQCGECFNHNVSLKNHLLRRHSIDSTLVLMDENPNKGRPMRKAQCKKRARKSSTSLAANEELDIELEGELQCEIEYSEESSESDSDKEEKKRGRRRKARRKKWKETK